MSLNYVYNDYLKDTDGVTNWKSKSMLSATATYYSNAVDVSYSSGHASLLVLTSAGSLVITFEVSDDNKSWYTPYDTDGNDLSSVASALTTNRWISFPPQVAHYIRFKFVLTSANSTVSAIYRQQELV